MYQKIKFGSRFGCNFLRKQKEFLKILTILLQGSYGPDRSNLVMNRTTHHNNATPYFLFLLNFLYIFFHLFSIFVSFFSQSRFSNQINTELIKFSLVIVQTLTTKKVQTNWVGLSLWTLFFTYEYCFRWTLVERLFTLATFNWFWSIDSVFRSIMLTPDF